MLLRDAQEETRVVYSAKRSLLNNTSDPLLSHISEVIDILNLLKEAEKPTWGKIASPKERAIGLLLLVALEIANETEVDSLEALKSVLLEESP